MLRSPGPRSVAPLLSISVVAAALAGWMAVSPSVQAQAPPTGALPFASRVSPQRLAAFVEAADRQLDYLPGEVIIRFKPGVAVRDQQRALFAVRSRPAVASLRWAGEVAVLTDASEPDAHVLAEQLRRQPEVEYAEPNYISRAKSTPTDPGYAAFQWNLQTIDMPRAWDINPGATADVIVAVIDTGITAESGAVTLPTWNGSSIQPVNVAYATNPDLAASRLVSPIDLAFWEGPVIDFQGHGTHVSGTVGEDANNGLAEVGMAYNVRIMPVKACMSFWDLQFTRSALGIPGSPPLTAGGCPNDLVAEGIRYAADHGAKVINLSLGGERESQIVRNALGYAVGRGVFISIAGGNAYDEGNPVEYPANYAADIPGVMSVGAINRSRNRAYYSGTASRIEISAPGGDVFDGGLNGLIRQYSLVPFDFEPGVVRAPRFDRYFEFPAQGTSMAAPHVAGLAALLISQGVTSPAAIEALIKATALDLGSAGRDDEFGDGLIQPRLALRGFGVVGR